MNIFTMEAAWPQAILTMTACRILFLLPIWISPKFISTKAISVLKMLPVNQKCAPADGKQALEQLNGSRVHLAICDVNMPNLDGYGTLKHHAQMLDATAPR